MREIIIAMGLSICAVGAAADWLPPVQADVFQAGVSYECVPDFTSSVMLTDGVGWQSKDHAGRPFGDLGLLIKGLTFDDGLEVGSGFVIKATGGVSSLRYRAQVTGRSVDGEDQIMFAGAFGRGFITASPFLAGAQYPVQVTWKGAESFYSTAYLYCLAVGPAEK